MPKTKIKTKPQHARRPSKIGMQNKRYRQTEEAILQVLLESKKMPSTKELTQKARISRSTLYRHHRAIPGIIPDYERDILAIFRRESKKAIKQERVNIEKIYLRMLIFVLRYKRVFRIIFRYNGDRIAEDIVLEFKDTIIKTCHLPKNSDRMLKIYAKEVAGIVEDWGNNNFSEHKINHALKDIMYLTTTLRQRLGPVR